MKLELSTQNFHYDVLNPLYSGWNYEKVSPWERLGYKCLLPWKRRSSLASLLFNCNFKGHGPEKVWSTPWKNMDAALYFFKVQTLKKFQVDRYIHRLDIKVQIATLLATVFKFDSFLTDLGRNRVIQCMLLYPNSR